MAEIIGNSWLRMFVPKKLINILKPVIYYFINLYKSIYYGFINWRYYKIVRHLREKDKIKVAFFLIHDSVWKYEGIYQLMEKDDRFEPVVVVCPYIIYGDENMMKVMTQAYNSFSKKGYKVIKTYNEVTKQWLNIKEEIQPDIVFFTNPNNLTKKQYYITRYTDCLTCYAPYNFGNSHLYETMYNQKFHNLLWRLFAETPVHKSFSVKYALNKGKNVVVTGFPGTDALLKRNFIPLYSWKQNDKKIKRIIWAPHHSIDDNTSFLGYSTFLKYADVMLNIADEYAGRIQFAFKPHPILRNKLEEKPGWGKENTDNYYNKWNNLKNGKLVEGDYIDLFFSSDALIHDSGSFLIEYIYTGKPVLHTNRDKHITDRMNAFGILAFNLHYHAKKEEDIRAFIEDLLIGRDEKKYERGVFLTSELLPPNHKSASENIYEEIVHQLF